VLLADVPRVSDPVCVFISYARLYAFSRMLITPSTPSCMVKGNAVVVIGVDRHGVGRDNDSRWLLRALGGCSQEVLGP
jgi:hypothetical protein